MVILWAWLFLISEVTLYAVQAAKALAERNCPPPEGYHRALRIGLL